MKLSLPLKFAAAGLLLTAAMQTFAAPDAPDPAVPTPITPVTAPAPVDNTPAAPATLPGKGLAQHDFLYAGEAKTRQVFIVRKGKVAWSYEDPAGKGEISDATLMSNGNVLIAHQFAVEEITPDKKVIWKYDVPTGSEVHTAIPIGKDHVLFIQNGNPALVRVVNIVTGKTEKEFPLPVGGTAVHGQFRHARLTSDGTLMVAHMDLGKVSEYNSDGKELWSLPAPRVWGVTPLKNGNLLLVDGSGVREVNRKGETAWAVTRADLPDYQLKNLQLAWRLPNGNTVLDNWVNQWTGPVDAANAPVQALEVTPDKKVVWALRSWADPNLGPATTIQILDTPETPENVHFGDIK